MYRCVSKTHSSKGIWITKSLLFTLSLSVLTLLIGCPEPSEKLELKGSFKIEFVGKVVLGSKEKPKNVAPYKSPEEFTLKITALGVDGKKDTSFNGGVCIFSTKGILERGLFKTIEPAEMKNGELAIKSGGKTVNELKVKLRLAFGKTVLWVSDANKKPCPNTLDPNDTTRPYVGRSGAAPALTYQELSIRNVQEVTDSPHESPLINKYSVIEAGEGNKMVVTGVTSNGFFLTDLNEYKKDVASYHSIFVFTFSAPSLAHEEGTEPRLLGVGDIVEKVEGGIDEFSGHTQIVFPSYVPKWKDGKVGGEVVKADKSEMPKPIEIKTDKSDGIWSRGEMEKLESALVEVKNAVAVPFSPEQDGWKQFRQWPFLVVKSAKPENQQKCEELARTELYLHADPKKNTGSKYRACLKTCHSAFEPKDTACKKVQQKCLDDSTSNAETNKCNTAYTECTKKPTDAWFSCYFNECRSKRSGNKGIYNTLAKEGCEYAILLAVSSSTVPDYDPTSKEHLTQRFTHVRGILQQVKASAFFKLIDEQYNNEMSNNGYIIWVRGPEDLGLAPKK